MSIANSTLEVNNEALLRVLTNKPDFEQQFIFLVLSRFPSITQPILAKTLNDLVDVFESQGNLP
jgi:penicillin V acylase-like amidase (Ntn superfamily)